MTNRQYAQANSARATLDVLEKSEEIIGAYDGITEVIDRIDEKLIEVDELTEEQERDQTGVTENKEVSRREVVKTVLTVCGQIVALGQAIGDADLRQRAAASQTDWLRIPQAKLSERATSILTLAREKQVSLSKYGTTDALLAKLETQINGFKETLGSPREGINRRKTITSLIRKGTQELSKILRDELDPLMRQFETSHPQFYQDYHNARAIVDFPVIPRERRDASRKRIADRKAEVAARRANRAAQAQQRKTSARSPSLGANESVGLSN